MQEYDLHKTGKPHYHTGLFPEGILEIATEKGENCKLHSHTELRRQYLELRTAELTGLGTEEKKNV